ncbi:MAG: deoxyribose-phosphate aldolase [Bacteroidota bacterium]
MNLAAYFDHTALRPDVTETTIQQLCTQAKEFGFAGVCVPPTYAALAKQLLVDTNVKVATVIGFPLGYSATVAKVEEIKRGITEQVDEFDVVINLAALKSGNWNQVRTDLDSMVTTCQMRAKTIKVIIETALLTEAEIRQICEICNELEPTFVKTSTGFNGGGATVEAVQLLRFLLKDSIKIKASGGIRDRAGAEALVAAGADRLGASRSVSILQEH